MSQDLIVTTLNRLLVIEHCSLPRYLRGTSPWSPSGNETASRVLNDIANDQEAMVERLAAEIQARDGQVALCVFPIEFTDMHFLALDFMLKELICYQKRDVQDIEECAAKLSDDPVAHALALEALGAARAHLEALEDLIVQPA